MPCLFCTVVALVTGAGIVSVWFMCWPWRWIDRRKMAKAMDEYGGSLVEMRGRWWARWERVRTWTWVPVREYGVLYTDEGGQRRQAVARFYLPWWLNKAVEATIRAKEEFPAQYDYLKGLFRRPAEELFDLHADPGEMNNVAGDPRFAHTLERFRTAVDDWMRQTGDPGVEVIHTPRRG